MSDISHALESILDSIRLGKADINDEIINFLFKSTDFLKGAFNTLKETKKEDEAAIATCLEGITQFASNMGSSNDDDVVKGLAELEGIVSILSEYEEHRLKSNIKSGKAIYLIEKIFEIMKILN